MSFVKYQHYLARHHMSWFANSDGTNSFWSLDGACLLDNVKLTEIGGQNHLYEAESLQRNFVEKQVLGRIEGAFFDARRRIIEDRAVRRAEDREAVRKYVTAQILREGYLHKRLVQVEDDLRFLAKEMRLEKYWRVDEVPVEGKRKRASSILAEGLTNVNDDAKALKHHVVVFVTRREADLMLPDRGVVQIYEENGHVRTDGLLSASLKVFVPIAPNAALKLVRPKKRGIFADRETMTDTGYQVFLRNLSMNAASFVAGPKEVLLKTDLDSLPYFEPNAQRFSMIMQLYKAGEIDDMIKRFHAATMSDRPLELVRSWFYRDKFIPAINKLFNPENEASAETIYFRL